MTCHVRLSSLNHGASLFGGLMGEDAYTALRERDGLLAPEDIAAT